MKGKYVKQINNLVITQYTRKDGKPCFDIYTKQKEYITTVPNLDYAKRICEGCATYLVRKIMLKDLTTNSLILIEKELQKAHISYESVGTQGSNLLSVELSGDWKHDHRHLDLYLTSRFNLIHINNKVWDNSDDSDYYTATHYYSL